MVTDQTIKLEDSTHRIEAVDANLSGSTFSNVNLSGASLDDVNLSGVSINNANLSNLTIRDANLSGMSIADCNTAGMTINGIPVDDLFAATNSAREIATSTPSAATTPARTRSKVSPNPPSDSTSG